MDPATSGSPMSKKDACDIEAVREKASFAHACERVGKKGKTEKRWLLVDRGMVLLAAKVGKGFSVEHHVKVGGIQSIVVQSQKVGLLRKKELPGVLIKGPRPPDLLLTLTPDRENKPGSNITSLIEVLKEFFEQKRPGEELPVEWREPDSPKLTTGANLKKPPGYRTTAEQVKQAKARVSLPPEPGQQPEASTDTPIRSTNPSKDPPPGVPSRLWFVSPKQPVVTAVYTFNPSLTHHGRPVWDAPDGQRIFLSNNRQWAVGTIEQMPSDGCYVVSTDSGEQQYPHDMSGWQMHTGGPWELDPHTQCTDQRLKGECLMSIAAITISHHYLKEQAARLREVVKTEGNMPLVEKSEGTQSAAVSLLSANMNLLRPRKHTEPFSELEAGELRQLSTKLKEHFETLKNTLDVIEGVATPASPQSALGSPTAPIREPSYPSLTGATPAASVKHPSDILDWAWTTQSSQFASNGDTELRATAKADIYTSKLQEFAPAAVAVTDRAVYLCSLVGGEILHREPLETMNKVVVYTDRRMLGMVFPNLELFIRSGSEDVLLGAVRKLEVAEGAESLDEYVEEVELRRVLGLDSSVAVGLRKEVEGKKAEVERLQMLLAQERLRLQKEMDGFKETEDARVGLRLEEATKEALTWKASWERLKASADEGEMRGWIETEEGKSQDVLQYEFTRGLQAEVTRQAAAADAKVSLERSQLVLACTATVEKAARAEVGGEEAAHRSKLLRRLAHPIACLAITNTVVASEQVFRYSVAEQWAAGYTAIAVERFKVVETTQMEVEKAKTLLEEKYVMMTSELYLFKERYLEISGGLKDETNKTGGLLRSNKVLQQALNSCRFLDIHRVRIDNAQLREDVERRRVESEAALGRQEIVLSHLSDVVKTYGESGEGLNEALVTHSKAAVLEAEGLLRAASPSQHAGMKALSFACSKISSGTQRMLRDTAVTSRSIALSLKTASIPFTVWEESPWDAIPHNYTLEEGVYPVMEGWMLLGEMGTWKKRFFTLSNGVVAYQTPGKSKATTVLAVDGLLSVDAVAKSGAPTPGGPHSSFLWTAATTSHVYEFCTFSHTDRLDWIQSLRSSIATHTLHSGRGTSTLPTSSPKRSSSRSQPTTPPVKINLNML